MPTITHEGTTWRSSFTLRDEDGDILQKFTFEAKFAKLTPQNALSALSRAMEQRVELLCQAGVPMEIADEPLGRVPWALGLGQEET